MSELNRRLKDTDRRLDNLTARLIYLEWLARGEYSEDFDAAEYWQAQAQAECDRAAAAEIVLHDTLSFLASYLCTCRLAEVPPPAPSDHVSSCSYRTQCKRLGVPFDFGAGVWGVRVRVS